MKEQVKAWLKAHNHERIWLSEQLGVGKRTVDSWLSTSAPIPVGKLKLIERLMEDDAAAEAQRRQQLEPTAQVFSVEVDLPTFRAYGKAALAQQKTLEDWAIGELNEAADAYFAAKARIGASLPLTVLSEEPADYLHALGLYACDFWAKNPCDCDVCSDAKEGEMIWVMMAGPYPGSTQEAEYYACSECVAIKHAAAFSSENEGRLTAGSQKEEEQT